MKLGYSIICTLIISTCALAKLETYCCVCKLSSSKTGACATSGFNNKCPGTTKDCDAFGNNCGYCIAEDNYQNSKIIAGICYDKGYQLAHGDECIKSPYCRWGCDL